MEAPESNFEKVVDLTVRAARLDLHFAGVLSQYNVLILPALFHLIEGTDG